MAAKKTAATNPINTKRLFRSETDRIIGGVCGGLAEYFDLDASLIRLIFVVITLAGGAAIFVYLILWIILPSKSSATGEPHDYIHANTQEIKETARNFRDHFRNSRSENDLPVAGLVILVIGVLFLLSNFGFFNFWNWGLFWPFILIAIGLAIMFKRA